MVGERKNCCGGAILLDREETRNSSRAPYAAVHYIAHSERIYGLNRARQALLQRFLHNPSREEEEEGRRQL